MTRKLTITASDKYGLPTAMDDEVILGLVQLTGKADFTDRKVLFTRYELLKLLDWTDDTRNYNRLEQSLNRWLGVTLYYDKAWWSKEEQRAPFARRAVPTAASNRISSGCVLANCAPASVQEGW